MPQEQMLALVAADIVLVPLEAQIPGALIVIASGEPGEPEYLKGAPLKIAVIGCGYVGLPLGLRFAEAGPASSALIPIQTKSPSSMMATATSDTVRQFRSTCRRRISRRQATLLTSQRWTLS
jgi:hypothetical protein